MSDWNGKKPARAIWIGFDPREAAAFAVTRSSIKRFDHVTPIRGLVLDILRAKGLYYRPTEIREGRLWDVISEAPMATEFAISRFLVPVLQKSGFGLFMDCDMLARADLLPLFKLAEQHKDKAVLCVHHDHRPIETTKMDGQVQTTYARKNWSSVMLFNCDHPSNNKLTVDLVNSVPGRDLHRFCWLNDDEIGEIGPEWNFLIGHTDPSVVPRIAHFTDGIPTMPGYEQCEFSDEWSAELRRWAS
jgi:hypothetical protein